MDKAALHQFMSRHRYGVVSTTAQDGTPQSALVGIAVAVTRSLGLNSRVVYAVDDHLVRKGSLRRRWIQGAVADEAEVDACASLRRDPRIRRGRERRVAGGPAKFLSRLRGHQRRRFLQCLVRAS